MEGFHPVALEEEVSVDVEVAAVIARDLHPEAFHDFRLVEPLCDPAKFLVT